MSDLLKDGEWIYRRRPLDRCVVCAAPATVVLHVGRGGNYLRRYVCDEHEPERGPREEKQ